MPDPMPTAQSPSSPVNTARKFTNQQVGTIAQDLGSQSTDTTTALNAILAAILAKPSAT